MNFPAFLTVAGALSDIVTTTSSDSWRHWSDMLVSLRIWHQPHNRYTLPLISSA